MAPSGDEFLKPIDPFEIHQDKVQDGMKTPAQSEASTVGRFINKLSALTLDESKKDVGSSQPLNLPLLSSKLENIQPASGPSTVPTQNKTIKLERGAKDPNLDPSVYNDLMTRLSQHASGLKGQADALAQVNDAFLLKSTEKASSAGSVAQSIETNPFPDDTLPTTRDSESSSELPAHAIAEIERLKRQLNAANVQVATQAAKLSKTRVANHQPMEPLKSPRHRGLGVRQDLGDDKSDISDGMSTFGRNVNTWESVSNLGAVPPQNNIWSSGVNKPWSGRTGGAVATPQLMMPVQAARNFPMTNQALSQEDAQLYNAMGQFQIGSASRPRANSGGRGRTANPWATPGMAYPDMAGVMGMNAFSPMQPMGVFQAPPAFDTRSATGGSTLSAMAPEFTLGAAATSSQPFAQGMEPMNYRKLLDRSVSCNWKYIVDKIVGSNDQQASIFLQQKLKLGTAEQKFEIVEAIVNQAYPLMINRFGNFLVQRCFEHGTPEQVIAIANAIRGNTLSLSMDAFGCHVIQKAFDAVPEEYKAIMVHELLRRIPETIIHRYACHVWQKLFELRWSDSPPPIMKYVNEALKGMWHEVALGETGSLVVQNIFENCLEDEKRPCIDEVLKSIDIVAHGQFGNWCIQHICEHGAPADRTRAVDHVLRYATEYSMDQFASKVVEKCLKISGTEFLERYLQRICEGRADRPRIPLIDIASDQYGNYLIQYILTHANAQHREIVASHIRKHMVSLRGSKFGSRVGLLCCNPAYATRPGPAVGAPTASRFPGANNASTGPATPRFDSAGFH